MSSEKLDKLSYICPYCAKKLGGKWPEGHQATQHIAICDCCGNEMPLCNVGDWNWPDGIRRGMRD